MGIFNFKQPKINMNPMFHNIDRDAWIKAKKDLTKSLNLIDKIKSKKNTVVNFYYDVPIDEKSVFILGLGTNVRGNMQFVLDELNHSDDFKDFNIYVRTKNDEVNAIVNDYIKKKNWSRTSTVPKGYMKRLHSCKYLITESFFPYDLTIKPGQVLIDTWHGTPLKKIGLHKNGKKKHKSPLQQKCFLSAEYMMFPNEFTRKTMMDSYEIETLLPGKPLMLGYPRTGGLLAITPEKQKQIYDEIAPNGEHVYAYMPTFRGYMSDADTIKRELEFLSYIDSKLRNDQILYVNLHHHIGAGLDCSKFKHIKTFPPLIDSYELLTVTEALISDYSSVFFDYLILGKQIILHIDDYETYLKHQGLNLDISTLPFDLAYTNEDVVEMLNRGKTYDDTEIRNELCGYDSVLNAKNLCKLISGKTEDLSIGEFNRDNKKHLFAYVGGCEYKDTFSILSEYVKSLPNDELSAWAVCDLLRVDENLKKSYPFLHEVNVIGTQDTIGLSMAGECVKKLYLSNKIPFASAIELLKHEYALMGIKMFGRCEADYLILGNSINPEVLIGLALSNAKHKVLMISKEMIDAINSGDKFLSDAISFASDYCQATVVTSKEAEKKLKSILSGDSKKGIFIITDMNMLEDIIKSL